ncbi:hypothetical protein ACOSQ2_031895 [Xanthoceras sorbifolium]
MTMMSIFSSFDALCAEFYRQKLDFSAGSAGKPKQEASSMKRSGLEDNKSPSSSAGSVGRRPSEEQRLRIREGARRARKPKQEASSMKRSGLEGNKSSSPSGSVNGRPFGGAATENARRARFALELDGVH